MVSISFYPFIGEGLSVGKFVLFDERETYGQDRFRS